MRSLFAASTLLLATVLLPALAQALPSDQGATPTGRNITATGKTMPPPAGGSRESAPMKAATEAEMLKAQKATEERNKAWDSKMRKTMGTICNGC